MPSGPSGFTSHAPLRAGRTETDGPAPAAGEARPAPPCPNCGAGAVSVFCAECGERQPSHLDLTIGHIAREAYEEFLNVDGRLWRSIVALLSRPGFLAQEYFAGRRSRYMRPFSLFVLLNVLFFVIQPYTGLFQYSYREFKRVDQLAGRAEERRAALQLTKGEFETKFDDALRDQKKSILLFAIPIFAVALMLTFAGSGRTYVEHLVFSVHAYAFTVFYLLASGTLLLTIFMRGLLMLGVPSRVLEPLTHEAGLIVTLAAGVVTYLAVGLRRFYSSSWPAAVARGIALFIVQGLLIKAYRDLLFTTVLLSL